MEGVVLHPEIASPGSFRDPGKQALRSSLGPFSGDITWRTLAAFAAVFLIAAGALLFDATTPRIVSVDIFYVAIVLVGFWFPWPKSSFVLAALASALIIAGYWVTIPDNVAAWENWLNRASAVATAWLAAAFVWYIRDLAQELQIQIDISNRLSREITHRVGNSLQLVASFLRLRAANANDEKSRQILKAAGSQVMVIGRIQRMLSHSGATEAVSSDSFIKALVSDLCSTAPNRDALRITVEADAAELTSTTAIALGAFLSELINNALKHAFRGIAGGELSVRFFNQQSPNQYVLEVEDDGIGLSPSLAVDGFGLETVTELTRLMRGALTHQAVRPSDARPGTKWRLVVPSPKR